MQFGDAIHGCSTATIETRSVSGMAVIYYVENKTYAEVLFVKKFKETNLNKYQQTCHV
jgi:Na+-driven multidrug efflux pump